MQNIPFVDLQAEYHSLKDEIDTAVARVLESGWYILGQEVGQFEAAFAAFCHTKQAIGVASGTDALLLALRGLGVRPGDEVITVSHTAVATAAAIELSGAVPVFVDVNPLTYTMDPDGLAEAITGRTKVIIPVHLYGHPADLDPIRDIANEHQIAILEDCAQAHGAVYKNQVVGSIGRAAAFSFYPTKNVGAVGDGGLIVTNDEQVAENIQMLRQYGWRERYISDIAGYNSRLDELQAAILQVKLRRLEAHNQARRRIAQIYQENLHELPLQLPQERPDCRHVYHLYVIQTEQRDALRQHLAGQGIATAVHYPLPVHLQPAYTHLGYKPGRLPVTERLAGRILSLPMYPQMPLEFAGRVSEAIRSFFQTRSQAFF